RPSAADSRLTNVSETRNSDGVGVRIGKGHGMARVEGLMPGDLIGSVHDPQLADSLARGRTLPGSWFIDPAVFELEQQRIFARCWQYAGLVGQIPAPGDYFTCRAGRIPVVVVRDEAGSINAFVNVCRHRGAEVVNEGCGHRM